MLATSEVRKITAARAEGTLIDLKQRCGIWSVQLRSRVFPILSLCFSSIHRIFEGDLTRFLIMGSNCFRIQIIILIFGRRLDAFEISGLNCIHTAAWHMAIEHVVSLILIYFD